MSDEELERRVAVPELCIYARMVHLGSFYVEQPVASAAHTDFRGSRTVPVADERSISGESIAKRLITSIPSVIAIGVQIPCSASYDSYFRHTRLPQSPNIGMSPALPK